MAFGPCACACARACACACVCACSPEGSARSAGSFENEAPEWPKSTPEGANMASWRPPGASWAPGAAQVATQAALRPPLGGSWGALGGSWVRLGTLLAPPGAVLGLQGRSPEAPGEAPGRHFGRELWKSAPGARFFRILAYFRSLFVFVFGAYFRLLLPPLRLRRRERAP